MTAGGVRGGHGAGGRGGQAAACGATVGGMLSLVRLHAISRRFPRP